MQNTQPTAPQENPNEISSEIKSQPLTQESIAPQPPKSSIKKLVLGLLTLLMLIGGSAGYFLLIMTPKQNSQHSTQTSTGPQDERKELAADNAFALMLEKNVEVETYHVAVNHTVKSRSGIAASDYDKTYTYEAEVDVTDLKSMKLKATFDLNESGKQAKGETVWVHEDVYIRLNEALVTNYNDIPCSNPQYRTAKSPTIAALKAGFVKTVRSDQTLNCGHGAYQDFIEPITFTNTPFGDFPLFKASSLNEIQQRAFKAAQNGQYKTYDGASTELNGTKAFSYNVTIENYKIAEMSKVLANAAGFSEDSNHIISFGEGDMGQGSPGRYLKVWVNAETGHLMRVQSIVDTPNVDIMFNTTMDFSKINEKVLITAPN